jgi:hypothetical protein
MSLKSIALTLVGAALVGAAGAYAFATRHGELAGSGGAMAAISPWRVAKA